MHRCPRLAAQITHDARASRYESWWATLVLLGIEGKGRSRSGHQRGLTLKCKVREEEHGRRRDGRDGGGRISLHLVTWTSSTLYIYRSHRQRTWHKIRGSYKGENQPVNLRMNV